MVTQQGNLAPFAREIGNPLLESFYSQVVRAAPTARFPHVFFRFSCFDINGVKLSVYIPSATGPESSCSHINIP